MLWKVLAVTKIVKRTISTRNFSYQGHRPKKVYTNTYKYIASEGAIDDNQALVERRRKPEACTFITSISIIPKIVC